ncbi:MAG TPA: class I SAM-dependent methyltransferase [Rhizomicrobium sp.]|nr:class I SAM-dependent methyltransferase [Rhizomicrobium sp.]
MQRICPYPAEAELAAYYNDKYLEKKCTGSVSHLLRFSAEYRPTVFNEYAQSVADAGLSTAMILKSRILDFGCADGIFLDWLRSLGVDQNQLCGIDISDEMVQIARQKGHRAVSVASQAELSGEKFDLVTLWDVLEHLLNPVETLGNLTQFLKPGGHILLQTPRTGLLSDILAEAFEHYLPIEHIHLFPRDTLINCMTPLGFRIIKAMSFGANAPATKVPRPYKSAYDQLAKRTDNGATQVLLCKWQ